jgi:hypothetical protein
VIEERKRETQQTQTTVEENGSLLAAHIQSDAAGQRERCVHSRVLLHENF